MNAVNSAPLMALDAFVLDTETTGLDPTTARIVEIGAIRLASGRMISGDTLYALVRPDTSIPAVATGIHGIDDAKVAGVPIFAEVWPKLRERIGVSVVVGHNLGFDLAVLRRECQRAHLPFDAPRALDTRLLAQVVEPNLAGYTLESLSAWLGIIPMEQRHSALGDATTTARIFMALVPRLRDVGVRTLGEATRACRALPGTLDEQHRAGWEDTAIAPSRSEAGGTLGRIDSYPYRHRVRDVMRSPAQFVKADTSLGQALSRLMDQRISSLYVRAAADDHIASGSTAAGIVTERDLLRTLSMHGAAAFDMAVSALMSRPLAVVPADAFVYRAIGRMGRLGIRHLGVVNETGDVIGALSSRDLLRLRASEALSLGDEIDQADDVPALGAAWAKLPRVVAALLAEDVRAHDVAAVVSREIGALTRRAAALAEQRMRVAGHGPPPCQYAMAVLGSAGRGESLLALDQDNALVFAEGEPGSPQDLWFEGLGVHVANILHEVGVPYCKGGVMAKNPQWRGSTATWRDRVRNWIAVSRPEHLLSVDIFFDLRPVSGSAYLCIDLWREAFELARGKIGFAKLLAEAAGGVESGLGMFGRFRTVQGRIDIKKTGLFGIVTTARVLAICHHVVERSTLARIAGIKTLGIGSEADLDALSEAHETLLALVAAQQVNDIEHGLPPSNAIEVRRLSTHNCSRLRAALEAARHLDDLVRELLFRN